MSPYAWIFTRPTPLCQQKMPKIGIKTKDMFLYILATALLRVKELMQLHIKIDCLVGTHFLFFYFFFGYAKHGLIPKERRSILPKRLQSTSRTFFSDTYLLCRTAVWAVEKNTEERPNILFLFADDWGRHASVLAKIDGSRRRQ